MRKLALLITTLTAFASTLLVRADSITNNFTSPFNYAINGILGDTNWDGVYLGGGDIPQGNLGGSGSGFTVTGDSGVSFPGFLAVQTSSGDWSAPGDDGFFLWKLVSGDFDVSVQSAPPWQNLLNNFGGLLVRAFNTNGTGEPVSFTATNASENFLLLWRAQEFSISEIRQGTNGANVENTFANAPATNTAVPNYYRITRVGDVFTFYWKTNQSDDWVLITNAGAGGGYAAASGSVSRPDWHGQPVQVGIAQAVFAVATPPTSAPIDYFTDFELTGPGVTTPASLPAAPSNVTITSPNPSGSVNVNWTPGAGSDGSVVVVRANKPLITSPVNGFSYVGDPSMTDSNYLAASENIVYAGSGNSVTVTGLGGSNNTYNVAVFSYSTTGGTTPAVYNTAAPATNSFGGPGTLASLSFTLNPASIPVNGVAVAKVTATYTTGDSIDVSSAPSTIWSSANTAIAIATNGTVTGISVGGPVQITATFAGISGNNSVTVHTPAFVDTFTKPHDFLAKGVAGSAWDGVYQQPGDVPSAFTAGFMQMSNIDTSITSNNDLYIAGAGNNDGWEGTSDNGFYLYKYATNDFQAVMHIATYDNRNYTQFGLMARKFGAGGAPGGTGTPARETFWRWFRFDEFGISTSSRYNRNNNNQVQDTTSDGAEASDYWLLMVRQNRTNFLMFKRQNQTDPWTQVPGSSWNSETGGFTVLGGTLLTNSSPLQVGIFVGVYTTGFRTNLSDYFMLDGTVAASVGTPPAGSPGALASTVNLATGNLQINWTNAPDSDGSIVVVRANKPVNSSPVSGVAYTANAAFAKGSDLGSSNYVVYVGSGTSVTVSNLAGGVTYYSAVYAYSNSAAGFVYNQQTAPAPVSTLVGALQSVVATVSEGGTIPLDGVGILHATALFSGGGSLDVTSTAVFTNDNSSEIVITNINNLDAIGLGTSHVTVTYGGKSNTIPVTVRAPVYVDNFTTSHDYLASGSTAGTIWDGVYFGSPSVYPPAQGHSFLGGNPDTITPNTGGQTLIADANVTAPGFLTVETTLTAWEFAADDGFLLFKYVPGDFEIRVHVAVDDVTQFPPQANFNGGVMARAYGPGGSPAGGTLGTNESWVSWNRFDLYGIDNDARSTTPDGNTQRLQVGDGDTNYWLLLVKSGAEFHFFEKAASTNLWIERFANQVVRPDLLGGMQVGIAHAVYASASIESQFDSAFVDAALAQLQTTVTNGVAMVSWAESPGAILQSTPALSHPTWTAVGVTPVVTNGFATVTVPVGDGNAFFRLVK